MYNVLLSITTFISSVGNIQVQTESIKLSFNSEGSQALRQVMNNTRRGVNRYGTNYSVTSFAANVLTGNKALGFDRCLVCVDRRVYVSVLTNMLYLINLDDMGWACFAKLLTRQGALFPPSATSSSSWYRPSHTISSIRATSAPICQAAFVTKLLSSVNFKHVFNFTFENALDVLVFV